MKTIELELMRSKEMCTNLAQEKIRLADENAKLHDLLRFHGISPEGISPYSPANDVQASSSFGGSTKNGSLSHSQSQGLSPSMTQGSVIVSSPARMPGSSPLDFSQPGDEPVVQVQENLDYDQIGVDFVLR